jgi:hypothetical protein
MLVSMLALDLAWLLGLSVASNRARARKRQRFDRSFLKSLLFAKFPPGGRPAEKLPETPFSVR